MSQGKSEKHITEILLDNGYLPHRKNYDPISREFTYIACTFKNDYSTFSSGKLDYRFLKDGKEVVYGLHEFRKPPTLIYPRKFVISEYSFPTDDEVNRYLADTPHEEVFNSIEKCLKV